VKRLKKHTEREAKMSVESKRAEQSCGSKSGDEALEEVAVEAETEALKEIEVEEPKVGGS